MIIIKRIRQRDMYKILISTDKKIIKTKYYSTKEMFDKWKIKHTSRYGNVYNIEGYVLENNEWKEI